ncbi:hypothetical protein [Aquimarina algiphila]|uniref:hypothetical protein n=1 Tax=Aquimarina algiphila TaxID=2047982 RepID=UPI002490682A|nr:hypothetical protein [Aquimarina algiphila]
MNIFENWEGLISIAAIIISLASALISYLTYKSQNTHNHITIETILQVGQHDLDDSLLVTLENTSFGPAIINKISVKNDKGEIRNSLYNWLKDALPDNIQFKSYLITHENFN